MKRLVLFVLLVTIVNAVGAQDRDPDTRAVRPYASLTTIMIRDILRDYNLGYSFALDYKRTFEVRLGWVHPNRIVSRYYEKLFTSSDWKFKGPSIYLQMNTWQNGGFREKQFSWFYGWYAGYRYVYHTDSQMPLGGRDHSETDEEITLSQWRNDVILCGSLGMRLSKFSTSEVSLGVCLSWTNTNVSATRFYPYPVGTPGYEQYKNAQMNKVLGADGFSIVPVLRVSSRFGWFSW